MKVLLVTNQLASETVIGNPIVMRIRDSLLADERISKVDICRYDNKHILSTFKQIRRNASEVDIIHIHFGGLYAILVYFFSLRGQKKPIFITFHGTDIHAKALKTAKSKLERLKIILNQKASFFSINFFDKCGFVAEEMLDYLPNNIKKKFNKKFFIHKLGVNYSTFNIVDKEYAKQQLGLSKDFHYALFSDVSNSNIKRRDIAESIISQMDGKYQLLSMSGVAPYMVPLYINAAEFVLLTSDEEGSPNIIRESLSLNKPVFSVDVGDAKYQLKGLKNSCIISRDPIDASTTILKRMQEAYLDNTRFVKREILDFVFLNRQVVEMYVECVEKCRMN